MERQRGVRRRSLADAFDEQAIGGGVARGGSDDFLCLLDTAETGQEAPYSVDQVTDDVREPLLSRQVEDSVKPAPAVVMIDEKLVDRRAKLAISRSGMKWSLFFYIILVFALAAAIFFELGHVSVLAAIAVGSAGVVLLLATLVAVCTRKKWAIIVAVVAACLACVTVLLACVHNVFVLVRSGTALRWSIGQGISEVYIVYQDTTTNITANIGNVQNQLNNTISNGGTIEDFISGRQPPGAPQSAKTGNERSAEEARNDGDSYDVANYQEGLVSVHGLAALEFAANEAVAARNRTADYPGSYPGYEGQLGSTGGATGFPGMITGVQIRPSANDWLTDYAVTGTPHLEIKNTCHNDYWDPTTSYRKGVNIASQSMARAGLFCAFSHFKIFEFQQWPVDCAKDCGFGDDPEKFIGSRGQANRYEAALAAQQGDQNGKSGFSDVKETVKVCAMLQTATACSIWNLGYFLILPVISAVWLLLCVCSCGAFVPSVYNGCRVIKNM
ncbi:conserved hypothetical protein [Neospora caninum Liverpool]|uniref:Transmembrane protein n=1 Tax=Neospora caninum (strain Liverpool) TaxID=572307 RepID=F0VLZ1_NEOCL|nr:conserved hypothetical protein [Neospora caninum Liverpool]CBZ54269.1 conserved hypothetical protein [Neospora caninum Liverpool]CEL68974.1 TPA: hypothetical protein BN1204_047010 [Neospora caninum Liverpool]|eukprot:XP_003884300.1 conserved hypothetical protein [Neospora caninum Liverpool]